MPDPLILRSSARAIAGALVTDDLARKTARALIEVAGARRVFVVIDAMLGEARATSNGARVTVRSGLPRDPAALPREIVRWVESSKSAMASGGEGITIGGAPLDPQVGLVESTLRADPYFADGWPPGLLATPLLDPDGNVLGVVYLEADRPFEPDHVQAVDLLADLAATALLNAQAYDDLALRLEERHRELGEAVARHDDAAQRLRAQERLASLGTIASGIAHEIKNPLNFVNNFAEISVGQVADLATELERQRAALDPESAAYLEEIAADLTQNVGRIHEHGRRADNIVRGMLEHARGRAGQSADVELNALVREYATSAAKAQPGATALAASLELTLDPSLGKARVVPEEVGRVILNLVSNGLDAARARRAALGDGFLPLVQVSTKSLGDRVEVRVRDNGGGIPRAIRDRVYEPFFTTKPAGEGTGLGLPLTREIVVDRHGGEIEFETEEGDFTEFVVTLPRRGLRADTPA